MACQYVNFISLLLDHMAKVDIVIYLCSDDLWDFLPKSLCFGFNS
jgi:hypothetical protein